MARHGLSHLTKDKPRFSAAHSELKDQGVAPEQEEETETVSASRSKQVRRLYLNDKGSKGTKEVSNIEAEEASDEQDELETKPKRKRDQDKSKRGSKRKETLNRIVVEFKQANADKGRNSYKEAGEGANKGAAAQLVEANAQMDTAPKAYKPRELTCMHCNLNLGSATRYDSHKCKQKAERSYVL
jgi:hypothetical protein